MRFFNTSGPIVPADHYHIPPLDRLDLDELLRLVRTKRYFTLHAPRQTGKTSALFAFRDLLNGGSVGDFRAVYVNVEVAQPSRGDRRSAMREILGELGSEAEESLGDPFVNRIWPEALERRGPGGALREVLGRWAKDASAPLVVLVDEVDSLIGDTLVSVLRQLRAGYPHRPDRFPQTVILCGVRDVRDYRMEAETAGAQISGGSAFNIAARHLRLGDFAEREVASLLAQHTKETGQEFSPEALEAVWNQTRGQPWLVNALAAEACFEDPPGRERAREITIAAIRSARERLILSRAAHLDQLAHKLAEDRVRRVVEPLLTGAERRGYGAADLEYVRDLGLVAREGSPRVANPIYAEVIPRALTAVVEEDLVEETAWYVDAESGRLDAPKLLEAFQRFFREHSEHWVERFQYREAGPQLLLQAFLQRIVNGGGRIEREYGLGRGRTDLLILWPRGAGVDRAVVECKIRHRGLERTIADGLEQIARYRDRCGAREGHLVVFDRDPERPWSEKLFRREEAASDGPVTVWGM